MTTQKESGMYGVLLLRDNIEVSVVGLSRDLDLHWAKGMIGALPVFGDKDSALAYAEGKDELVFSLEQQDKK